MLLFWDTSAAVSLVFNEPNTAKARRARAATERGFAWSWMQVEAEAALLRRNATMSQWESLTTLLSAFVWLDVHPHELPDLRQFNKALALRAADAGHTFIYSKAHKANSKIQLVTFDREMQDAAVQCALPLWHP